MTESSPEDVLRPGSVAAAEEEFHTLMVAVCAGSQEAARELLDRYGHHIRRVIRRRLEQKLRTKFDSLDFVQPVWATFFAHPRTPESFAGPEQLLQFLVTIANHKLTDGIRQFNASKRDLDRECSLETLGNAPAEEMCSKDPAPSEVAIGKERFEQMLDDLPALQRSVVELLSQGKTHAEVARDLNISEKTIQRLLGLLRAGMEP